MKFLLVIFISLMTLLFTSCSEKPPAKPIVLSTSVWIGFSPIYYAHAMGWLKEINIEVLVNESVGDSMNQFEKGSTDLITVTQSEYLRLKQKYPDYTAAIIHDRSNGGDVIVANRTLDQLRHSDEAIELYLEPNTVNEEMWRYLMKYEGLPKERFKVAPRSQEEISQLKSSPDSPPMVAITFNPYDVSMVKNGFARIASTKDSRYLVVDGIHGRRSFIKGHQDDIAKLKAIMTRAIEVSKKDPKAFYTVVKPYLNDPTYEEFEAMMTNIEWIYPYPSAEVLVQLQEIGYQTEDLVK